MSTVELLTMGRVGVDLHPEQIGVPLTDVRTFRKLLGGSATNVAVAMRGFGVDASRVGTHPTLRTPVDMPTAAEVEALAATAG